MERGTEYRDEEVIGNSFLYSIMCAGSFFRKGAGRVNLGDNTEFTFLERKVIFAIVRRAEKRWKKLCQGEDEGKKPAPMFRCQFDSCELCPMDMECWRNVEKMMQIVKLNCILRGCVYRDDIESGIDEELPPEFK